MADNQWENQPATKGDLQAVKGDLQAVKTELKTNMDLLDQKVNTLDQKVNTLGVELAKTHLHIDRAENNMMTALRGFKSEILSAIDKFAGEARNYRRRDLERGHMLMEQHDKLQNHESRITLLETPK